ncbi:KTSC domain-containing protein [Halonatronum saccharophilum]|uniref:KTSC domain-containing protein n=1 Tax=Halonatronum saccharophilum TaxID=150060 RepID=UPI00047FE14B|nr:KTSC domain-containing protein [Halonatronum saccharophilum]
MDRTPVSSSNLDSVGYDPATETLEIAFHSGGVYQYSGVPQSEFNGLMSAGSHGRYFHHHIRGSYPYFKVG